MDYIRGKFSVNVIFDNVNCYETLDKCLKLKSFYAQLVGSFKTEDYIFSTTMVDIDTINNIWLNANLHNNILVILVIYVLCAIISNISYLNLACYNQ